MGKGHVATRKPAVAFRQIPLPISEPRLILHTLFQPLVTVNIVLHFYKVNPT